MPPDRIFISVLSSILALLGLAMASRAADDAMYVAGFLFVAFGVLLVFRMISATFAKS